jgi:hypothetical protein
MSNREYDEEGPLWMPWVIFAFIGFSFHNITMLKRFFLNF